MLLVCLPAAAAGQDTDTLELMNEPTTFLDVIDAAEERDALDVNLTVSIVRTWQWGRLEREGSGPRGRVLIPVGNTNEARNTLLFGAEIGLFHDLALTAQLPLTLSDDRSLDVDTTIVPGTLDVGGTPLFGSRVVSPTRSGVDWLGLGLAWSITNQRRDPNVPTWVVLAEGRLALGEPLRACRIVSDAEFCRPTIDSTGASTPGSPGGVSRGSHGVRIETRASVRTGDFEPYVSLAGLVEFFGPGELEGLGSPATVGMIHRMPPITGSLVLGIAAVPWSAPQSFQRVTIDLRGMADYVSEGRSFTPLYDALGTSDHPLLASLQPEGRPTTTNPTLDGLARVAFTGVTTTSAYARLGGRLTVEVQAARYVRFQLGGAFQATSPIVLTQADPCNASVSPASVSDPRLLANCLQPASPSSVSVSNPHFRGAIDTTGSRFRLESAMTLDLFANVTAMF